MSGLLDRVASRALGAPSSVAPNLPPRFADPGDAGAGLQVVEAERVVAAPPAAEVARGPRVERHAPAAAVAPPRRPHAAESAIPPPAARRVARPDHRTDATPAVGQARPAAAPAAPATARPAVAPASQGRAAPLSPPAVSAEPRVRSAPVAAPRRPAGSRPAPAAQEPAVRVHIGRLEVRADVPAPAPALTTVVTQAPEPAGLTLAAYLRGEREVS